MSVSVDNLNLENVKAALLAVSNTPSQLLFQAETPLQVKARLLQGKESKQLIQEIREEGDKLLQEMIPTLTYSLFRLFSTTGSRREYELVYFRRRNRLTTFGLLAWLEGADSPYLDALSDTIATILDEYTWCLPAHILHGPEMRSAEEAQYAAEGLVNHSTESFTIDLFAAETAFALSEISALLGDALPQLLRVRIREEVLRRILRPFVTQAPSHWETATHNWASVCGGSIAAAAIYTLQDEDELAAVLERAFPALASYLSGFEEDGACTEGYMYWQYGFGYFTYAADLILRRTGGAVNWFQTDKVRQVALFQQKSFLHGRKVVNFSDSQGEAGIFMGLSGYLKQLYPEIEHPELSLRAGFRDDHCSRWAPALRNLLWSLEDIEESAWQTAAYYLPDAQWLVSRQLQEQGAYVFAAKGGHNNEPHNHNDIGHFILYAQGETLLPDLGSGQYSRKYFGPERYEILCNGSQSHSVPIIDGLYQQAGAEHRAEVLKYSSNEEQDDFALEISSAYDTEKLNELVRRFTWHKTEPPTLEVTDSYEFAQAPTAVVERFMAWHLPQQAEDGRIVIAASAEARVLVSYDMDLFDWEVETLHHVNHFDQPETCYALDFKLKPGVLSDSNLNIHAAFRFDFQ
ncbi:heparinase II/III domain-containing protein [Paenibacillus anseongense]|uniref:heparinase II/III domain-containing protein n=1 Tax=Paenibacillus TaxID=44249 RepID=UPI002DBBA6B7|nr:heparinase II/III family protein [Paenibacillus anseongense]MEC0266748.1 heparinase II/III family protein [Paenibacillus anseongense]